MRARFARLWAERKARIVVVVLVASGVVFGAVRYRGRSPSVPTLVVKRGEFIDSVRLRGEMKALKSVTLVTPAEAGNFQILKIAADGSPVKQGDVVVEFDGTQTEQDLAQFKSALKSAQAEIEQARATAKLTEQQDSTDVMKARYDVETAKLDASKQEVVSKIEGAEARLKVADGEQKLKEAEAKLKSDQMSDKSTVQSKIEASQKAAYDVQRTERALTTMILRAPLAGTLSLIPIWRGEAPAPLKPGDRAWPGAPIAEIPDVSTLRVSARVEETDRGRVAAGQTATVHMDAIADRDFTGRIEQIGTLATADFSGGWPFPRDFDLSIVLDQSDPRVRPGLTAQITIIVDKVPDAITIPVQAMFQRSGATVAYVWTGSKFEERVIEAGRRSGDQVMVAKGLQPDERIALTDPTVKE